MNVEPQDSIVHQGRNNKVAKVALIKAKPKIPSEGLGRILGRWKVIITSFDKFFSSSYKCSFNGYDIFIFLY